MKELDDIKNILFLGLMVYGIGGFITFVGPAIILWTGQLFGINILGYMFP